MILANATKCKDGKWRSVLFEKIYDYQMFLGEAYRMELAREIGNLGYSVSMFRDAKSNRWTFEIDSKRYDSRQDIETMSQRRHDIKRMADAEGKSDGRSMAHFAKITRDEKIDHSRKRLEQEWVKKVKDVSILKDLVLEARLNLESMGLVKEASKDAEIKKLDDIVHYG